MLLIIEEMPFTKFLTESYFHSNSLTLARIIFHDNMRMMQMQIITLCEKAIKKEVVNNFQKRCKKF